MLHDVVSDPGAKAAPLLTRPEQAAASVPLAALERGKLRTVRASKERMARVSKESSVSRRHSHEDMPTIEEEAVS